MFDRKGSTMTSHTHQTAPTQYVEANGIRFAYRRFGKASGVPIVFNLHYMGTMDYLDPAVTDGFARKREVILFNNAGVSSSSGEVPTTFEQMGANAVAFSRALGLNKMDVLGFSIGGMVAQEITLQAPNLVRKLILVGTGPRGQNRSRYWRFSRHGPRQCACARRGRCPGSRALRPRRE
jgi:pimeloyl-ACP methyl ester carboxylesterase